MNDVPQIPAAWHQDPNDPRQLRYWDGTAWTEHRTPNPEAPPALPPLPSALPAPSSSTFPTAPMPYEAPMRASAPSPYEGDVPTMHGAPVKKSGVPWWGWLLIAGGVGVVLMGVAGIGLLVALRGGIASEMVVASATYSPDVEESAAPDAEQSEEPPASVLPGGNEGGLSEGAFGPGIWLVGTDIEPGTYRPAAPIAMIDGFSYCYWSVASDASRDFEAVLANGLPSGGLPTVTLVAGNEFESSDCGDWVKVDPIALFANANAATTIEPGVWLVGEDIAAGTYRSAADIVIEDEFDYCYWEIAAGIEDSFFNIVDNGFIEEGRSTVTLEAGQQFESDGCGSWDPSP